MRRQPKYLWFLILTFTMIIVFSCWFDARIIRVGRFDTDAGTLLFPITYLLSAIITEVYGYKFARQAIWCGFLFNVLFIAYGQIVIHLPSPDYETYNNHFQAIFELNARVILASLISYIFAEPFNAYLIAKSKLKMQGKNMNLRFMTCSVLASAVDSSLYCLIAFYGIYLFVDLIDMMVSMMVIKVSIEVLGASFFAKCAKFLQKIEGVNTWDQDTNFSLFNIDTTYTSANRSNSA